MRAFKTKPFARWATGEGLNDSALANAVVEMNRGLVDASLGGQVFKKRLALPGRGKRGSTRMLVAFRHDDIAFFVYGFAKSERDNISNRELRALKLLAKELLGLTRAQIDKAKKAAELYEIGIGDDG